MREKSFYVNRGSFFVCTYTFEVYPSSIIFKSNLYYMKKRILLWYIPIMGIPLIFRDIDKYLINANHALINAIYQAVISGGLILYLLRWL